MALILAFRNISQLAEISDYEYNVFINEQVIDRGTVTGHPRAEGWDALVTRCLAQRRARLTAHRQRKSS